MMRSVAGTVGCYTERLSTAVKPAPG